jgi:type IV secretion system protein VirB10
MMSEEILVRRPLVARAPKRASLTGPAVGLACVGLGIFFWLSEARASIEQSQSELPALASVSAPAPAEAPPQAATPTAPPAQTPFFVPKAGPVTLVATPGQAPMTPFTPPSPMPVTPPPATDRMAERLRAPTLVIDLAQADTSRQPGVLRSEERNDGGTVNVVVPAQGASAGSPGDPNLSDVDRFSARVGSEEVEVASARRMSGLDRIIPQGAIIGAVMETALNSDLPGYARAVTQRDVYSFDGSTVLIPAGSRLIGQYKSGVAQGGSRVFVLWTRLIRSDGVSIDLASPATDELGRGGLGGKVNRHFLQRFGGAILTSVLTGGISAATAALSRGSTVIVGNAGQATSLATQATQNNDIPPTITTRQGAAVRVFVARDLDFSRVGPAR